MAVQGALAPFGKPDYQSVNTDREEPCIVMACKLDDVTLCLSIQDARPGFTFRFTFSGPGNPAALDDTLTRDAGFAVAASGHLERHVPRERAKTMIDELISLLRPVPLAA
jgi:hypothetical protein